MAKICEKYFPHIHIKLRSLLITQGSQQMIQIDAVADTLFSDFLKGDQRQC